MRTTDTSDETFREDMSYMRMLMDRIMRTLYASQLRIDPKVLDEPSLALGLDDVESIWELT